MRHGVAFLALAYGVYFLYLFATGGLYFYIHPMYVVPTALTGAVLVALGVASWRANGPGVSRLAVAALAVPVALAYAGTFTDGSLMAFLVFGPMIDIKSLLLMLTVFSAKTVALVAVVVTELVFLLGLVLNYWVG